MNNIIGIERTAIQNGDKEIIYDNDNVRVDGNTLYTEKQSYNIVKKYELPFKSYKYIVQDIQIKGGNTYVPRVFDLSSLKGGKLQGINSFLTGNDVYDKQILKFVKREYRKKYNLQDIDKMELKYDFSDAAQQIEDITDEIKQYTKMYTKQKPPKFNKEKQKLSKRIFGVDYDTFNKYKNQVIGAQQYVNENISDENTYLPDDQRMYKQIFGGCECEDQGVLFQPNQYEVLKYTGGKSSYYESSDNGDSIVNQLQSYYKKEYKYSPSGYLSSAINVGYDKLRFLQNGLKGGNVFDQKQPEPVQVVEEKKEEIHEPEPVQVVEEKKEEIPVQVVEEKKEEIHEPIKAPEEVKYDDSIYSSSDQMSQENSDSDSDEYNYNIVL